MTARRLASRAAFVGDVTRAAVERRPFAAGKIGLSEKHWMYYPLFLRQERSARQRVAYEAALAYHCRSSGIFPASSGMYLAYAAAYAEHLGCLDSVGVARDILSLEDAVIDAFGVSDRIIYFEDQEPDRSLSGAPCYLPSFEGRRVLIVCPFARLLSSRANRQTYEAVWAKLGKRWFAPAAVEAVEFPYGFARETQARFTDVLDLYDHIAAEMRAVDFDIALIAAGALGIPLAAHAKRLGRIGLSLGGHVQVLFGVLGKRWRDRLDWQRHYFTDAWIDMPEALRPAEHKDVCDEGAYW